MFPNLCRSTTALLQAESISGFHVFAETATPPTYLEVASKISSALPSYLAIEIPLVV